MYMQNYYGFVYEWTDAKNGFKYIGSHYGSIDDGYVSSNTIVNKVYKKRPNDLTRTILEYVLVDDKSKLYEVEQYYLNNIPDDELYTSENRSNGTYKFYNMKKLAVGGNGKVGSNGKMKNTIKYYHRDTLIQRFFKPGEYISDEWIKGVPSSKCSLLNKIWFTNIKTNQNRVAFQSPGDDWVIGKYYNPQTSKTGTRKKINTPDGLFNSTVECAEYYGIVRQTVSERCRSTNDKWNQWFFRED